MGESLETTIKAKWDIGYPKFERLFNMTSAEIQEKVSNCDFDGSVISSLRKKSFSVTKKIKDDVPWEICLEFYDYITITPFGIQYHPEHGSAENIVDFSIDF